MSLTLQLLLEILGAKSHKKIDKYTIITHIITQLEFEYTK